MNILNHTDGVYEVRHSHRESSFLLSIMWDELKCFRGVKAFEKGAKRPRHKSHLLRTPAVRQWLDELEIVDEFASKP